MPAPQTPIAVLLTVALAAAIWSPPADPAPPDGAPGFTVVPYGWLAGLDGTIGAPGAGLGEGSGSFPNRINVSVDPEYDLVGFMFYGEWRAERWMGFFDSVWANYQQDAHVRVLDILPDSSVRGEVDGNIYTLAAGYRARDWGDDSLTVFGGLRYYNLQASVSAEGGLLPNRLTTSGNEAWLDLLAGARWSYRFGSGWSGFIQGDAGAGDSRLTWQVFATLGYRFSWGRVLGGYRYLAVDYDKKDYRMDISLAGPAAGVAFDF